MKLPSVAGAGPVSGNEATLKSGKYFLFANGDGSVRIETFMGDATWQFSDDTTFTAPCNQVVELPDCFCRLAVVSGTVTAELRK